MTTLPGHNAEGNQVWNPSVGVYFKPAANQRESYGGVIGALNDQLASQSVGNKAYPHNFAGIIAAIDDLTFSQKEPPVFPDVKPPGGNVVGPDAEGNYDWVWGTEPRDGELWYDTNQGRLFIAVDGEYYQTNGADGLVQVTTTSVEPPFPVVGQFWWDASTRSLYIFDGFWLDENGDSQSVQKPGYTPLWRLLIDLANAGEATTMQTSATLPLVNGITRNTSTSNSKLPPTAGVQVQSEYNQWLMTALEALDTASIENDEVTNVEVGTTPPSNPSQGDLFYDTVGLELSIWYEDENSGQWVPTAVIYNYDSEIAGLKVDLIQERITTEQEFIKFNTALEALKNTDIEKLRTIENKIDYLELHVENHPEIDLTNYVTEAELTSEVAELQAKVDLVNAALPAVESYTASHEFAALQNYVTTLPTVQNVGALIATAKQDLTSFVTQADINNSIGNIALQYLPRTGGTLNGAFKIEKTSPDVSAFDFSKEKWHSKNTHKYRTNTSAPAYATFGTTDNLWEYAWNFDSNEDFCWVHNGTDKVFSITKEGPACSQLFIGDIQQNSTDGRHIFNKIDVKDRLTTYQSAFVGLRQAVANATDFDELKANILLSLNSI